MLYPAPLARRVLVVALLLLTAAIRPAIAQTSADPLPADQKADAPAPDAPAVAMVEKAKDYFGVTQSRPRCAADSAAPGEVVVCGRPAPNQRLERTEPTAQADSKFTALGTSPMAPASGGVTMRACFLQKCPKELLFIDLKALPEAPKGSDADLIAKGEMRAP